MAPPKKTLYQILGVARDANDIDVGMAHDRRMHEMDRTVHPDPSQAALVQQAFEILSDPKRRAAYDSQLLTAAERSAAAEQATPDFEIGGDGDDAPKRKIPVVAIAIGAVVAVVILFFALRSTEAPKAPAPVVEAPKPAPAPPPPTPRTRAEVLADVSAAGGPLLSYSMSGASLPLGLALAIDRGAMVTTCHGIPAGSTLVVRVGKEQHPADLTVTDETLDLCRLSVAGVGKAPLKVATEEPKVGDKIFVVGMDAKGELAASEGTIKALRKVAAGNLLELSVPILPTGSGGGIFDPYGKLVGIATTPHTYGPGVHVAIPASWIAKMRSRVTPAK